MRAARGRTRDWAEEPSRGPRNADSETRVRPSASAWEASVRFSESKRQLTITMPGWGLEDNDMEQWCTWFRAYMERAVGRAGGNVAARDVNVADNRLTAVGVRSLLETLSKCRVAVPILKLHHNHLEDGAAVADFIIACRGSLRELHLSHNELDTSAAAEIMLASAAARDENGDFLYPRPAAIGRSHGPIPLWMRLEQNFVDAAALSARVEPAFKELGRPGHLFCNVSSKACTPHFCAKHRSHPPAIHAKHLSNQRARPPPRSESSAQDILNLLLSRQGSGGEAAAAATERHVEGRKPGHPSHSSRPAVAAVSPAAQTGVIDEQKDVTVGDANGPQVSDCIAAESTTDASDGAEPISTENEDDACTVAKVLRWDEELGQWVADEIEIPTVAPDSSDGTGRFKVSQELGNMMGNELKSILAASCSGEGVHSTRSQPDGSAAFGAADVQPPPGFEDKRPWHKEVVAHDQCLPEVAEASMPPHLVPSANGLEVSTYQVGDPFGDPPVHRMTSRTGARRGGSQPSGSDVKKANGFAMNPQATEFVPSTAQSAKGPLFNPQAAEFNMPAELEVPEAPPAVLKRGSLNPQAAEFTPHTQLSHSSTGTALGGIPPSMRGISASLLDMTRLPCNVETGGADTCTPPENSADSSASKEVQCHRGVATSGTRLGLVLSTVPMQGPAQGGAAADGACETVEVEHACRPYSVTDTELQQQAPQGLRLQEASERIVADLPAEGAADDIGSEVTPSPVPLDVLEACADAEADVLPALAEAGGMESAAGAPGTSIESLAAESHATQVVHGSQSSRAAEGRQVAAATACRRQEAASSLGLVFHCASTVMSAVAAFGSSLIAARRQRK